MSAIKEQQTDAKPCTSLTFLKKLPIFANLPAEEVSHFANAAQIKTYKKGLLHLEEEQADFFYIIDTGWLKLYRTTEEGEEVILAMLTKNSLIGENAIFNQQRYPSSAQVVEEARLLSIPLAFLQEKLRVNNQLLYNMLGCMEQDKRRHELQLEQYLFYSAPQRIGCFLLGLCPKLEQKDGVKLDLPYDKVLIASTLGMKGETFSRALNILRDETGLHITGRRVKIDSMEPC